MPSSAKCPPGAAREQLPEGILEGVPPAWLNKTNPATQTLS